MKQIRKNTFETNSSSMHSLQITCNRSVGTLPLGEVEEGILYIECGEFGWGYDVLRTPAEKLCYIVTELTNGFDGGKYRRTLFNR